MYSYLHPCDEILQAMERIYRYRMTTTSGGNLSIRDDAGDVWITPARVDKGSLRREDIVHAPETPLVHAGGGDPDVAGVVADRQVAAGGRRHPVAVDPLH